MNIKIIFISMFQRINKKKYRIREKLKVEEYSIYESKE